MRVGRVANINRSYEIYANTYHSTDPIDLLKLEALTHIYLRSYRVDQVIKCSFKKAGSSYSKDTCHCKISDIIINILEL